MELQWEEKMKRITEITKRDILDLFRNGLEINEFFDTKTVIYHYFGRIEEIAFLKRMYDLGNMPSTDSRYENAEQDIWQHTVNNDDYPYCWVFEDERFGLQNGEDEIYLKYFILLLDMKRVTGKNFWQRSIGYCKMMDMNFILLIRYLIEMFMDGEYIRKKKTLCLFHILNVMQKK